MTVSSYPKPTELMRRFAPVALAAVLSITATACQTISPSETTGSFAMASPPPGEADWRRSADAWGERYRANPNDPEAAINYAQALRGNGQRAQAVAVLEQASLHNPKHMGVLGAYGRALADVGNYKQALEVLNRAHAPDQPDWRVLSVQGAVLDQMGQHEEAQRYYATALRIVPDEPSVLSNLGLSYALSKDLVRAEATLRRAAAQSRVDPRVRQIWPWSSACKANSPKLKASRRPICRPTKRQPMWPICARCWRNRTAGKIRTNRVTRQAGRRAPERANLFSVPRPTL